MISDSIMGASIHSATIPKDLGKKKRTNRSAKLKQSKLDARRGQWLAQANGKAKEIPNDGSEKICVLHLQGRGESHSLGTLETVPRKDHNNGCIHHYSDSESPSNSPVSCNNSLLSSENSGSNFSVSSSSSGSITSGGSCSGNNSEEDEADEGLDDWETVADALAITDPVQRPSSSLPDHIENGLAPHQNPTISPSRVIQSNLVSNVTGGQAWKSDDVFRPPCLPNLSKQRTFPLKSNHQYCPSAISRACKSVVSAPSSCPICYEDLDLTDTSFIPCLCGFRLCLFCHKRILEEDGRCPGCRKKYHHDIIKGEPSRSGGSVTFRLARSSSMVAGT